MTEIVLYKFSGAGNDFVVLDGRQADMDPFRQPARIGELCRQYRTDGLMILGQGGVVPGPSEAVAAPVTEAPSRSSVVPLGISPRLSVVPGGVSSRPSVVPGGVSSRPSVSVDFTMEFYNPDGSGGMMCGNGGRCIVAFAHYLGLRPASADGIWHFLAPDGLHTAQILAAPGKVPEANGEGLFLGPGPSPSNPHSAACSGVSAGKVSPLKSDLPQTEGGPSPFGLPKTEPGPFPSGLSQTKAYPSPFGLPKTAEAPSPSGFPKWTVRLKMIDVKGVKPMMGGYFLNTGTRHFVKFVPDVEGVDMEKDGPELRWADTFQPEGTNANFVEVRADGLHVRTFEKGVEAETLACGTGLTASALAAFYCGIPAAAEIPAQAGNDNDDGDDHDGGDAGNGLENAGNDGGEVWGDGGRHGRLDRPGRYRLQCRRGDWLEVDFHPEATEGCFTDVYLTGPAELVRLCKDPGTTATNQSVPGAG